MAIPTRPWEKNMGQFSNPTPVQIGHGCQFLGDQWEIVGRMVLGVVEDGVTYYWHEFHMKSPSGGEAYLEYEEDDGTISWIMHLMYKPMTPHSQSELSALRKGDYLDLDGKQYRVKLRDRSTVHHIEGDPPEGVAVGYTVDYVDLEGQGMSYVAEWTPSHVEYMKGTHLSEPEVIRIFGLQEEFKNARRGSTGKYILIGLLVIGALVGLYFALK